MNQHRLTSVILVAAALAASAAPGLAQTTIPASSALPSTITFTANNPDSPTVSASSAATISFATKGGAKTLAWQVQVQAASANFGSCPSTIPANTIRVTCTSATITGGGGSAACGGAFNLSTGLQTIAGGNEGNGIQTYAVTATFTFTDSWSYLPAGSPCTLGLNYLIIAN